MSDPDRSKGTVREVETLYSASSSSDEHSPPELDRAILEASRRAVRFHWLDALLDKTRLFPIATIASWQLLTALALGALIGVGLDTFLGDTRERAPTGVIHAGDPPASRAKDESADTGSPESWLRRIGALILDGRITAAEAELRAFRQRYPDYDATAQQHPLPHVP